MDGDFRRLHRAETLAREIAEGRSVRWCRCEVSSRRGRISRASPRAPGERRTRGTTVSDGLRAFGVNMDDVDVVLSQGVRVDLGFDLKRARPCGMRALFTWSRTPRNATNTRR